MRFLCKIAYETMKKFFLPLQTLEFKEVGWGWQINDSGNIQRIYLDAIFGYHKAKQTSRLNAKNTFFTSFFYLQMFGEHTSSTDRAHHPLINFMVSSQNGPVFSKAVDALGTYKDAHFMGELFIKIIEEVGVDSSVQIITDNAPACNAAGMIVETKYPQVFSFMTPFIVNDLSFELLTSSCQCCRVIYTCFYCSYRFFGHLALSIP